MRITFTIILLLIAGEITAQGYQSPSRELVESYLDQINSCKDFLNELEADIADMEKNAQQVTLAQYNEAKALHSRAKTCLAATRAKLDELRKDYPGWFNNPGAVLNLSKGNHVTPKGLNKGLEAVTAKIRKLLDRLEAIEKPSH